MCAENSGSCLRETCEHYNDCYCRGEGARRCRQINRLGAFRVVVKEPGKRCKAQVHFGSAMLCSCPTP